MHERQTSAFELTLKTNAFKLTLNGENRKENKFQKLLDKTEDKKYT